MRRLIARSILLVVVLLSAFGWSAPAAHADDDTPSEWRIARYHVDATTARDGLTSVQLTVDFDFHGHAGHGMYLVLPERMRVRNDPARWRMLDTSIQSVSSPSGAPAQYSIKHDAGVMQVKIGDPHKKVDGIQTYLITYTIRGIVEPHASSGYDEVNWNAVGNGWQVPMSNIEIRLSTPFEPRRVWCFSGSNYTGACMHYAATGSTATFQQDYLGRQQGVQVVAGYPAGSFQGAEPRYTKRHYVGNMFPLTPLTGGVSGVLALLGVGLVTAQARRKGRDAAFADTAPNVVPGDPNAPVTTAHKSVTAVQFAPPRGVTPGEGGTLIDERANKRDVTATIIDLAVREYLVIERTSKKDFTFTRTDKPTRQLLKHEQAALTAIMRNHSTSITTQQMRKMKSTSPVYNVFTSTSSALNERVAEMGWFNGNPATARLIGVSKGIAVAVLGAVIAGGLSLIGWGMAGLAIVIVGLAMCAAAVMLPARTALGTAITQQVAGFKLYLETAEADQIRFEEGVDIFSRYLPWAVAFGVADRWVGIFQQLAQQGRYDLTPTWYGSYNGMGWSDSSFGSSLSGLSSAMSSTFASTAPSSGSSGSSGGGGFGGGGGGGW